MMFYNWPGFFFFFFFWDSQDGKFSYGYASSPGKRSSMEDYYEARIDGVDGEIVGLFGVFDGNVQAEMLDHFRNWPNNKKKSILFYMSSYLLLFFLHSSCFLIIFAKLI